MIEKRVLQFMLVIKKRFPLLNVFASRAFRLLWMGQTVSVLGDGVLNTALAWLVLQLTGSATAMGVVVAAQTIPTVILLVVGGASADRLSRRWLMLTSDSGRAVITFCIVVLGLLHLLVWWHLIFLSIIFGIADSFFLPAYRAIVPQVVAAEDLVGANALTALSLQVGRLLGPALGALLVATGGTMTAFAFDGLTFVVSASCLVFLSVPRVVSSPELESEAVVIEGRVEAGIRRLGKDLREGLGYVVASPWLWVTILVASFANIAYAGGFSVALPRLVHDFYHQGVWLLGVITASTALGAIVANVLMGQLHKVHRRGLIAYLSLIGSSITFTILGISLPLPVEVLIVICAGLLGGFFLGIFEVLWVTLLQELVPNDKLGRVSSLDMLGSYTLMPVGFLIVGILADRIGAQWIFLGGGLLNLILFVLALCVRGIRRLD